MKLPPAAYSAEVAASATKAGSGSIRQRRIKSLAATAKQSDSPCVRQGDIVWLGAVGAAWLFVERWSENKEGTQQAQTPCYWCRRPGSNRHGPCGPEGF
jgi:hypothetical protein